MGNKLILTSYGLTTAVGRKLIGKELKNLNLAEKKIFLFHGPYFSIEEFLIQVCEEFDFSKENIILSGRQKSNEEVLQCDFFYVTEGNTFEILQLMRDFGLDQLMRQAFAKGNKTYIGASAGAAIAGVSIEEVLNFDRNHDHMTDFRALGLFDGIVIPHYTKGELKRYIENSPGIERKYRTILSVANEKSLIMEV